MSRQKVGRDEEETQTTKKFRANHNAIGNPLRATEQYKPQRPHESSEESSREKVCFFRRYWHFTRVTMRLSLGEKTKERDTKQQRKVHTGGEELLLAVSSFDCWTGLATKIPCAWRWGKNRYFMGSLQCPEVTSGQIGGMVPLFWLTLKQKLIEPLQFLRRESGGEDLASVWNCLE